MEDFLYSKPESIYEREGEGQIIGVFNDATGEVNQFKRHIAQETKDEEGEE